MEISTSLDILSKIITITSEENVAKLRGCNFIRWCPLHSWGGTDRRTFITIWALLSQSGKERNVCNASMLLFRFLQTVSILPFSSADKLFPSSLFVFCGNTFLFFNQSFRGEEVGLQRSEQSHLWCRQTLHSDFNNQTNPLWTVYLQGFHLQQG